jgi:hypothetical protein
MDKRSHWSFSVKNFPPSFDMPKPFEIDPAIIKSIYEEIYKGNLGDDPIAHLQKYKKRCVLLRLKMLVTRELKLRCFITRLLQDH